MKYEFLEQSLVCPHCGQKFGINLIKGAKGAIQERVKANAEKLLRAKWLQYQRYYRSDDKNIAWLSGYKALLEDLDLSKYEALELLKKVVVEEVL